MKDLTKEYYENNSEKFIDNTIDCDMQDQYNLLEKYLKDNVSILDLGFGSARDMLYFKSKGYKVIGLDFSSKFCEHAKQLGFKQIYNDSILQFDTNLKVDAIWACASLLHIKPKDLPKAFNKCYNLLKNEGYMYVSFKLGEFEGELNGRYFNFVNEEILKDIYQSEGFDLVETYLSDDVRKEKINKWLNLILKKSTE